MKIEKIVTAKPNGKLKYHLAETIHKVSSRNDYSNIEYTVQYKQDLKRRKRRDFIELKRKFYYAQTIRELHTFLIFALQIFDIEEYQAYRQFKKENNSKIHSVQFKQVQ